jgi:hypothetical protein
VWSRTWCGPLGEDQFAAALGACRADHGEAAGARELDRGDAHAAAGTVDEDGLARLAMGAVEERLVGGGVRHVHCRSLGEGRVGREGVQLAWVAEAELGVSAARRAAHVDAIADLHLCHTRTDNLDNAGCVRAWRVGQLGSPIVGVRAQIGVHRVDADGENAHEDLARPWLGRRHLLELEDRGAAILGYADGLHGQGSFRWR